MRFKHSVSVSINNFVNVFKLLLYKLAFGVVFFSIAYLILNLGLSTITKSAEFHTLKTEVFDFVNALFTGKTDVLQSFGADFREAFKNFSSVVAQNRGTIAGCLVGVGLVYLLSRFVGGLAVFAIGSSVNDKMSTFARTRFSHAFFKNIGKASLYQLIYVPVSFLYDALSLLACWFFFFYALTYALSLLPIWGFFTIIIAIFFSVTGMVCLQALKLTLISAWMPKIITDGLSVPAAFRQSIANRKEFGRRFVGFLMAVYCIVGINVFAAIFTVGSALLITIPLSYIFLLSMQFVNHYRATGKKYFVSLNTIRGGDAPENPEA